MIRVLVADDEAIVRDGLRVLIELAEDIAVVAEAADGIEAVELARTLSPDVAVVDIRMPNMDHRSDPPAARAHPPAACPCADDVRSE